jgi:PPOX class probable F420-dependent enzyme
MFILPFMMTLSDEVREALSAGRLAHVTTINPDGSPQVSAVWVGLDGDDIVIGHLMGGRKVTNIKRDPRVALTVEVDGANLMGMTNYLIVYGNARLVEGGAPELLQQLAEVYIGPGVKFPPMDGPPPGHVIHITPERVGGVGPWVQ